MIYNIFQILGLVLLATTVLVYLAIYYITYMARKKYSKDFWVKTSKDDCMHQNIETHFSDVFGYYYVCNICKKDVSDLVKYGCDNDNICYPECLFDSLEQCKNCEKIL